MRAKEFYIEHTLLEAAYQGNIGMMEMFKFKQKASPEQWAELQKLISKKLFKAAWTLIQSVTGVTLHQKGLTEGGWASTLTQGTKITPQLVQYVMKLLQQEFVPLLNTFLKRNGLGETEVSAPGGSATYYERDLEKQPNKEYGDVDVQFHIPRIEGTTNNANMNIYKKAIKEFCDGTNNYSTDNGTNIILRVGQDYVQVDLVYSYYENKEWTNALRPEWNLKGVLANSLYSSFGEALSISFGGGHGVQVKTQNGQVVPFRTVKDVKLHTITNNPKTWAVDIAKYFGGKMNSQLQKYPGLLDEVRVSDIVNSFKGIAQSLNRPELLQQTKDIYLAKIEKAASSSKFDKAATPEMQAKAEKTKHMLLTKSQEIAQLFGV